MATFASAKPATDVTSARGLMAVQVTVIPGAIPKLNDTFYSHSDPSCIYDQLNGAKEKKKKKLRTVPLSVSAGHSNTPDYFLLLFVLIHLFFTDEFIK